MTPVSSTPKASSGPALLESVDIVFRLLDKLVQARSPLGVTEMAEMLSEPKPRIYRHLASMRQLGIIEQDQQTEKYRLGARLVVYGEAANEQFDLRAIAAPYLAKLRDATGQSAMVSVATNGSALVVASADSLSNVCISVKPGNAVLAHCSAQGRVVLAFSDEATQQRILRGKLPQVTPRSISNAAALRKRLEIVRQRMWDVADDEVMEGISALAAPIFRNGGKIAGTIGIVGTSTSIPAVPDASLIKHVQSVAAAISERLNDQSYQRLG